MTELKHWKRACVMAYLILANEEARVRRTHGALENRPPPAKKLYQRGSGNHAGRARKGGRKIRNAIRCDPL